MRKYLKIAIIIIAAILYAAGILGYRIQMFGMAAQALSSNLEASSKKWWRILSV